MLTNWINSKVVLGMYMQGKIKERIPVLIGPYTPVNLPTRNSLE